MKYKKLLSALSGRMDAILKEEEATAERMFAAPTERETLLLLGKIEDLKERYKRLQDRVVIICRWNKFLDDKAKEYEVSERRHTRVLTREYEETMKEALKPLSSLKLGEFVSEKNVKKLKRSSK